jgi:hypothetical protein
MIPQIVYLLCGLTSLACSWLLLRAYRDRGTRLLLWSGVSFVAFAANNILVFVDLILVPRINLSLPRAILALVAVLILVFGLVWEGE